MTKANPQPRHKDVLVCLRRAAARWYEAEKIPELTLRQADEELQQAALAFARTPLVRDEGQQP